MDEREMNGKPGDSPINDILDYGLSVFSPEIDALVRELAELVPRYRLHDMFDWDSPPPLPEFREQLFQKVQALKREASERGWETT